MTPTPLDAISTRDVACSGFCAHCGREHALPVGDALVAARELARVLDVSGRMDFDMDEAHADPRLALSHLWGEARGQMFGVMVCEDAEGRRHVLRAFSGQYNGLWRVDGWVPPVLDVDAFHRIGDPVERAIKALGREMAALPTSDPRRAELSRRRKAMSQHLMRDFHDLYRLRNFHGDERPMAEVFLGGGGMPTGVGDCCAPKLLNHAVRHGLRPLGLVEFYWGRENRSGTRTHGLCYPACDGKCRPILGFMLCGLDAAQGEGLS
ncbi:hypothetical protein GGQ74_001964 [Desulfobaculum xiamenense]|uniref:Uncharacterized protein n=1 Tax=Desulfobaculum xiamenense TaxID=995050 RepID=A0A846QJG9_9BACT|nr:hypothetical protein [Desulfobaculum xiamenense]NJB68291.1 hypothetical protein [Desulfobaculum xiamenense]